ncbi:unnamed protein product [Mytilus coruscus]|uniref:Uncharacterized protein n=1 Tax=Mytilus coruscus TaxID=42192 RepID=A0A6J8BQW8_MYTCO|nr:unnamed protein product [Mytilus coruscus]
MVDLKEHITANHRSKIELMPFSFLSENWILDGQLSKKMVKGTQEDLEEVKQEPTSRSHSPIRPTIYEGLALQQLTLRLGDTTSIFKLNLGVSIRYYQINLKEHKMLDALMSRMSALEYIADIKTSDELFPGKQQITTIPKPLSSPSTSGILLEDDSDEKEEQHENMKVSSPKMKEREIEKNIRNRMNIMNTRSRNLSKEMMNRRMTRKYRRKRTETQKHDEEIRLKEEEQRRQEKQKQDEEIRLKEDEKRRQEKLKQDKEVRLKEDEQRRQEKLKQDKDIRLKEDEQTRQERQKKDEEVRLKEEKRKREEKLN